MNRAGLPPFIQALLEPAAYPHPVDGVRLIETHISWVLIAGAYAYKIKKPLNLGFLDFGTPERRRFCCQEEIRLNRRLAPDIYLDVLPIVGPASAPRLGGDGPILDWAVRMRAFPADATLDREAEVTREQIDAIADRVARFHREVAPAPSGSPYGNPELVLRPVTENFAQIRRLEPSPEVLSRLDRLEAWSKAEGARLAGHFDTRKAQGFVRECHGDLHLGNIAWVEGQPLIFDCIEFNPALRFIDVVSEVAFLCMDLFSRGLDGLAWRFLNLYLEQSGDPAGLAAFRFYLVYRAMVRAKVDFIRAGQHDHTARAEALRYLALAERLGRPGRPVLLLMHGVSGSGKTTLSQQVLEGLGAIRLRSDVERKRLFGLGPLDDSRRIPGGIYTEEAGRRTFGLLAERSRLLLALGHTVIVDATFLKRAHRAPFIEIARRLAVPWRILSLQAGEDLLRTRVAERDERRDDASEATLAVLEEQLAQQEAFTAGEAPSVVRFDSAKPASWPARIAQLRDGLASVEPGEPEPNR